MDLIFPVVFGFICSSLFFLYISGYLDIIVLLIKNFALINKTMKELNITPELLNQYASIFNSSKGFDVTPDIMNSLESRTSNVMKKNKTYISKSGKCIHIYYDYSGTEYMITVPYNMLSSVDMIQYQMDIIYEEGDILTITQQPGIPYLINTNDLSCKTLKAINHETDVYHQYDNDIKPYFCEEICDK